jgi:phage shock protein PspC (stress-responsive transcriptional regulator)
MKKVKLVSRILEIVCKLFSVLYFSTTIYIVLVFMLDQQADGTGLFQQNNQGGFTIMLPFTNVPFLLGENTTGFKTMMILATVGYGSFAWLLGNVFNAFKQDKLFTREGIRKLTVFCLVNLIVPPLVLLISFIFTDDVRDLVNLTILHGIIGIFAYFMASIFAQGVALQDEQDYTL